MVVDDEILTPLGLSVLDRKWRYKQMLPLGTTVRVKELELVKHLKLPGSK